MKIRLKDISMGARIYILIILFLFSTFFSALLISYFHKESTQGYNSLALTNELQHQLSALDQTCANIFDRNIFDAREDISNQRKVINQNLMLLEQGGLHIASGQHIKPLKSDDEQLLKQVLKTWKQSEENIAQLTQIPQKTDSTFKDQIEVPINDSTMQVVQIDRSVQVNNPAMRTASKATVQSLSNTSTALQNVTESIFIALEKGNANYRRVFFGLALFNVFVFTGAFIWIRKSVISPLRNVGELSRKIASGESKDTIHYNFNDEIGVMSSAINSMAGYLKNASKFVHQIGDGNLNTNIEDLDDGNIQKGGLTEALISMKDKLKAVAAEDEKRNWSTQGVAKFANIIRNNNENLKRLSSSILSELTAYTHTNQGCIYLLETDNNGQEFLNLTAYYAYDGEKFFKDKLKPGEGIIGQTFLERKTTYLEEIPENFMKLKSGLTDLDPHSILIVPLIINDEAYGVLELSALKEIDEYKVEFIEQLSEMVASAIASVRANEQTQKLLEESQGLTEQMKSQEEEMRQNMEELSATQEEMARKERQAQDILNAVEEGMLTAELDASGRIMTANKNLATLVGSSLSSKNLSDIMTLNNGQRLNTDFWASLVEGEIVKGTLSIINGSRNTGLQAVFAPVRQNNGDYKILLFAQETETISQVEATEIVPNLDDLQEELQQSLDAMQITESALQNKLEYLGLIDTHLKYALIENNKLNYRNPGFKQAFEGGDNSMETLEKIVAEMLENGQNELLKTTINRSEFTLKILPVEGSNQHILLIS